MLRIAYEYPAVQCETGSNSLTSTECSRANHGILRTLELGHQKRQDLGAAPISRMIHSGAISSSADLTIETGRTVGGGRAAIFFIGPRSASQMDIGH